MDHVTTEIFTTPHQHRGSPDWQILVNDWVQRDTKWNPPSLHFCSTRSSICVLEIWRTDLAHGESSVTEATSETSVELPPLKTILTGTVKPKVLNGVATYW